MLIIQGERIHKIKTSVLTVDCEATMVTLDYEIDISGIPFGLVHDFPVLEFS